MKKTNSAPGNSRASVRPPAKGKSGRLSRAAATQIDGVQQLGEALAHGLDALHLGVQDKLRKRRRIVEQASVELRQPALGLGRADHRLAGETFFRPVVSAGL